MATKTSKKASQEDWHPADIKAALHKRGITLSGLAAAYGLTSSSTLSASLVRSYPANEQRIGAALGLHPKIIWPTRYYPDGSRKPQGFRAVQSNTSIVLRPAADGNGNLPQGS